jgi:hypothetical protein
MTDEPTFESGVTGEDGHLIHSPAEIEEWSERLRKRIARRRPEPGLIKTPDSIIADLEMVQYVAGQNIAVLKEAERTLKSARKALARAIARATQAATGKTVADREAEVTLATEAEVDVADDAEIAFNYAKRLADLTEVTKSATQTQAKQVEITYGLAGRRGA